MNPSFFSKKQLVKTAGIAAALLLSACQNLEQPDSQAPATPKPLPFTKFSVRKVDMLDDAPLSVDITEAKDDKKSDSAEVIIERKNAEDTRPSLSNKPYHPSTGKIEADGKVTLNLNLQAATVEHIVMAFADKNILNFNYLVDPTVKGAITLSMNDVEMTKKAAWELLEHLLWLSGAYMSENNNFVHVLPFDKMPKEQKLFVTHEQQPNVQALFVDIKYRKSTDIANFIRPFMTDGATVTDLADSNTIVIVETPANIEKLQELIARLDAKGESAWPVKCFICREVDPETLATELTTLLPILGYPVAAQNGPSGGAIKFMALPRLNAIAVSASVPEVLEEIGKWVKTLDREDSEDKEEIYFYNVKSSTVEILSTALEAFFTTTITNGPSANSNSSTRTSTSSSRRSSSSSTTSSRQNTRNTGTTTNTANTRNNTTTNRYGTYNRQGTNAANSQSNQYNATKTVFETDVTIYTEEESNRLTIKTTPKTWSTIKAFLSRLDVAPRQVAIQAIITEINLTKTTEYGISYAINKVVRSGDDTLSGAIAGAGAIPETLDGWSTSGLGLLFRDSKADPLGFIKAIAGAANTKILSEPQVIARSGAPAELQVGASIPVPTETTNYNTSSGNFSTNYDYVETGVIMTVTPFITAGNEVRLTIEQEVSSAVAQTSTEIAANTPPTIDKKKMSTEMVVPNNSTLLMGGMIQNQMTDSNTGIPLLKDIPYVGQIFRSNSKKNVRSELLILITVNVIDNKDPQEELLRKYKTSLEEIEKHNNMQELY